jgi:hypothetical protein
MGQHKRKPKLPALSRLEREDKTSAYHEATHVVIGTLCGIPVHSAFTMPENTQANQNLINAIRKMYRHGAEMANCGGLTVYGPAQIPDDVTCLNPGDAVPDDSKERIPADMVATIAPLLFEMAADFTDKRKVQTHVMGDVRSFEANFNQLSPEQRERYWPQNTLIVDPDALRPDGMPSDAVPIINTLPLSFPIAHAWYFLRLPATQKAITSVGDYLIENQIIDGGQAQRMIFEVFESEIVRFPHWTLDEIGYEGSPALKQLLLIDRLEDYKQARDHILLAMKRREA